MPKTQPQHADNSHPRAYLEQRLGLLQELRRELHRHPELSGQEEQTASKVATFLRQQAPPDGLVEQLGGHGLAAVYEGPAPGPAVMLRAELDAVAMPESSSLPHHSLNRGIAHKCGHDGHSALLCGTALLLSRTRPVKGRVILLFQPAEETGEGARAVLADPKFASLKPDWAFALHNVPGLPLGKVGIKDGFFAAASQGVRLRLRGHASHASEPHLGRSPAGAVATLMQSFAALADGLFGMAGDGLVTATSVRMGDGSFGITPPEAELCFTARASSDAALGKMLALMEQQARSVCQAHALELDLSHHDPFPATCNDPEGVRLLQQAATQCRFPLQKLDRGFPWSEDFGEFLKELRGAFCVLGAGEHHPPLHTSDYDFPEALLGTGSLLLYQVALETIGGPE